MRKCPDVPAEKRRIADAYRKILSQRKRLRKAGVGDYYEGLEGEERDRLAKADLQLLQLATLVEGADNLWRKLQRVEAELAERPWMRGRADHLRQLLDRYLMSLDRQS